MATAAISMPDLVPSTKLLNIFGFMPAASAAAGVIPKCSRSRASTGGNGACSACPCRRTPRRSRRRAPVDHLADQCRLIAVREAVHQARLPGARGEHRTDQHVRFDVDHHEVPALLDRGERMAGADAGIAGRLDHHIQARRGDQGGAVVGQMRAPGRARGIEIGRVHLLIRPAGVAHEAARAVRLQIGDAEHLQPGRRAGLGEEHGAEFAAADEAHPNGFASLGAARADGADSWPSSTIVAPGDAGNGAPPACLWS